MEFHENTSIKGAYTNMNVTSSHIAVLRCNAYM